MVEARLLRDERGRGSGVVRDSCYDSVLQIWIHLSEHHPWRELFVAAFERLRAE